MTEAEIGISFISLFGIIGGVLMMKGRYENIFDRIGCFFAGVVAGSLVGVILSCIFFIILSVSISNSEIKKPKFEIYSISRGEQVEGSFFLGTGTIETDSYYYFYKKGKYGFSLGKLSTNETYIVETDSIRPQVVGVHYHYNQDGFFKLKDGKRIRTIIYVPENTIIKDFKLK